GPAIAIGPNIHPKIFRMLRETAEENRIPYQIDVDPMPYGTDASVIQLTKAGVATGIVSVPLRYMHTSCEVLNTEDIKNTGLLMARFAERLEDGIDLSL
ncbi:MAG: M42 family peptidase, partial [Candidatus Methanofastidiosia archaeon]